VEHSVFRIDFKKEFVVNAVPLPYLDGGRAAKQNPYNHKCEKKDVDAAAEF